ncbi:putative oxalocrotonate tautomerase [Boeremia exigua]|uniref:putative oxalocrotonate tautomerase n=1 Tax=Boeremia exigua TaxID=749465 RepID=UPI001E8DC005|nr:putative oxalocrotonate tautomerase [Boeremia exigua]KAH6638723.1 putative oxalocrotonate tautomerase [Boeremia exigua]
MPFWVVYHTDSIFKDAASKKALAASITKLHEDVIKIPKFYVVVTFVPTPADGLYVGGEETNKPFVRITVDQIAGKMPLDRQNYAYWTSQIDAALAPHIAEKGYDWEYHVDETELLLWKINGVYAPTLYSPEFMKWKEANKVLPRETDELPDQVIV